MFRLRAYNQNGEVRDAAYDPAVSTHSLSIGSGHWSVIVKPDADAEQKIHSVRFSRPASSKVEAYEHVERAAPYCMFGDVPDDGGAGGIVLLAGGQARRVVTRNSANVNANNIREWGGTQRILIVVQYENGDVIERQLILNIGTAAQSPPVPEPESPAASGDLPSGTGYYVSNGFVVDVPVRVSGYEGVPLVNSDDVDALFAELDGVYKRYLKESL